MNRPHIRKSHIIIMIASAVIIIASVIIALVFALTEKGPVPMHFDLQGNVDGWGSAWGALLLPGIMMFTLASLDFIVWFVPPEQWNTGIGKLRRRTRYLVYADLTLMIVLMGLELALFSLAFTLANIFAGGKAIMLAALGMAAAMTATVIGCMVRANRHNSQ